MTLRLADFDDPELSVVMVTRGSWQLTKRAITALAANTEQPFELIVVDNASEDETRAELSQVAGLRLLLNEQNAGFGPASNQGATQARGEYLVLLNSDAFVHPQWLEPLLEALAQPHVGAAVPRYLHMDGSLQEAGVLLARDGTVLVYGDGDDPDAAPYRFRRTIDYGSAVCMLIPRETFEALGGFDDAYAPAYYEDADLCMRLAERGMSVLYEPRSTVTHVRSGSGGFKGAIELSERNRGLFAERWGGHLAGRPASFVRASDQAAIVARDALATPRLLICARLDEPGADRLAGAVLEGWPRGRLTWAAEMPTAGEVDAERWRGLGVELLDQQDTSWLDNRLFHYDAVVRGASASERLLAAVDRTQPQASELILAELDAPPETFPARLASALTSAGVAGPTAFPR